MHRKVVVLEKREKESQTYYRTLLKSEHDRLIYFEIQLKDNGECEITSCWFYDRNIGKCGDNRKKAVPLLWKTKSLKRYSEHKLLKILFEELNVNASGIKFISCEPTLKLTSSEYIVYKRNKTDNKYVYLILIQHNTDEGLIWETVLRNKMRRTIYVKLGQHSDETAYIKQCHYTDRHYKERENVTPVTLTSGYLKTGRKDILNFFNSQFTCFFNCVLFVTPEDICINDKAKPICGYF